MYVTGQYLQGTYRVDTLQCCLVRANNGRSKDKGEGGWVKHGSHREQSGIIVDDSDINDGQEYTKSASPPLSTPHPTPPQKCIPVMSLMCERMKTGKKLVICWGILPESRVVLVGLKKYNLDVTVA